jgi:hypothetical protein
MTTAPYSKPGFISTNVLNKFIMLATKLGMSPQGAQTLRVKGRKSGAWHSTPINPHAVDGARYLVAPRGNTQWARNLRAGCEAELKIGRKSERIAVTELTDIEKPVIIATYLDRWGSVTRTHFGATAHPDAAELERLAARTPVFRLA